jgi:hypothetical protein
MNRSVCRVMVGVAGLAVLLRSPTAPSSATETMRPGARRHACRIC